MKKSSKGSSKIKYKVTYYAPHIFVYGEARYYANTLNEAKKWIKVMDKEYKERETTKNKIEITIQKITKTWNYLNDQFIEETHD
jgi:hypothetical protein